MLNLPTSRIHTHMPTSAHVCVSVTCTDVVLCLYIEIVVTGGPVGARRNRSEVCEVYPYMVRRPICGKTSLMWEDVPHIGSLPRYEKTSHASEYFPLCKVFPCMGGVSMHGNTSRTNIYIYIYIVAFAWQRTRSEILQTSS